MSGRVALILVGPSAVGKTTVMDAFLGLYPQFSYIRSARTRPPRTASADDGYIYMPPEEFRSRVAAGEMLEYMEYDGHLYGTPASEFDRVFGEGKIPFLILDLQGLRTIRSRSLTFRPLSVYLWGDLNVLEQRLYDRLIGEAPSAAGLCNFAYRKQHNIDDYLSLKEEFLPCFDAFLESAGTPAECAENLHRIYNDALHGTTVPAEERAALAARLYDMALRKNNYTVNRG